MLQLLEIWSLSFQCPQKKRKGNQHTSTTNVDPPQKKKFDDKLQKECYHISALTHTITNNSYSWLGNSGASRHMTGYKYCLIDFIENIAALQVQL